MFAPLHVRVPRPHSPLRPWLLQPSRSSRRRIPEAKAPSPRGNPPPANLRVVKARGTNSRLRIPPRKNRTRSAEGPCSLGRTRSTSTISSSMQDRGTHPAQIPRPSPRARNCCGNSVRPGAARAPRNGRRRKTASLPGRLSRLIKNLPNLLEFHP